MGSTHLISTWLLVWLGKLVSEKLVFPPPEVFYSKLNMARVNSEDYEHARSAWKEFEIRNLGVWTMQPYSQISSRLSDEFV